MSYILYFCCSYCECPALLCSLTLVFIFICSWTIGIIIRDCEAIFFLIIESVPREHSSSSLEITYLYCVRCWFYTLYVVYCRMYCTHRACTVSGAVYSVCCVQYCTVCTLYCVRCCVDVSGLASERSHQLYHVYCILYSVCTVAGAVLTCLAWLVRGPTSCGWPWRTELGRSSSSSPSPAPQGSLHQQYSIHITPNT